MTSTAPQPQTAEVPSTATGSARPPRPPRSPRLGAAATIAATIPAASAASAGPGVAAVPDAVRLPVAVVTGAGGFVGWHVMCAFATLGHAVMGLQRHDTWAMADEDDRPKVLIHCAGVNRAADVAIEVGNLDAAARANELLRSTAGWLSVVYVNSTQAEQGSVYGNAKAHAGAALAATCSELGIRFVDLVVPGVFGEGGRPDYNSFVATFAHRVAAGEQPIVSNDREVELIHVAELADTIVHFALQDTPVGTTSQARAFGASVRISAVAELLTNQMRAYSSGVLPPLTDPFEVAMFNTLRMCMFPHGYPLALEVKADNRGHLIETMKAGSGGQSFVSWTHPGITRGNHYHRRKFERFLVLSGTAEIKLRRLFTDTVVTFTVTGDQPAPIDMPTLHTHNITNVGSTELITAFWTNEIFDPSAPDTYARMVEAPGRADGLGVAQQPVAGA